MGPPLRVRDERHVTPPGGNHRLEEAHAPSRLQAKETAPMFRHCAYLCVRWPVISRRRGVNYQKNLKKPSARSCCLLDKTAPSGFIEQQRDDSSAKTVMHRRQPVVARESCPWDAALDGLPRGPYDGRGRAVRSHESRRCAPPRTLGARARPYPVRPPDAPRRREAQFGARGVPRRRLVGRPGVQAHATAVQPRRRAASPRSVA